MDCGSGYSFTSSHATNHFAIALFLVLLWGRKHPFLRYLFPLWAASIALAQVYVGVHYPLDIFVGSLLGVGIGVLGYFSYRFLERSVYPDRLHPIA